jgi:hypothetical protein
VSFIDDDGDQYAGLSRATWQQNTSETNPSPTLSQTTLRLDPHLKGALMVPTCRRTDVARIQAPTGPE